MYDKMFLNSDYEKVRTEISEKTIENFKNSSMAKASILKGKEIKINFKNIENQRARRKTNTASSYDKFRINGSMMKTISYKHEQKRPQTSLKKSLAYPNSEIKSKKYENGQKYLRNVRNAYHNNRIFDYQQIFQGKIPKCLQEETPKE